MATLSVVAQPTADMAYTNAVFLSPQDFSNLLAAANVPLGASSSVHVTVLGKVFPAKTSDKVAPGTIALSSIQRTYAAAVLDARCEVAVFSAPKEKFALAEVKLKVSPLRAAPKPGAGQPPQLILEATQLQEDFSKSLANMILGSKQKLVRLWQGTTVLQLEVAGLKYSQVTSAGAPATESKSSPSQFGMEPEFGIFIAGVTQIAFPKVEGVLIKGQVTERSANKMLEVNFEALGIGGLDAEFSQIFRRAFASRVYPPDMVRAMGLNHVRGLMLYGPPGCGKTLIARQISRALQGAQTEERKRDPKVVNGPEILSKFVGETEKNIRELFADAEADQREFGDESELHVIIFDEIDAIAKKRGSTRDGTGVHDSLVNQLLSKIDGVDALNNILLIGMTNRLDMLDPALLRPGRFEVQVEISLPDEQGRVQILNIHTAKMRKAGYLDNDVDISTLAVKTKNFTGAEIEGLVKDAGSYAFQRQVDTSDLRKVVDAKSLRVTMADFEEALKECHPAFGAIDAEEEMKRHFSGGIIPYSPRIEQVASMLSDLAKKSQAAHESESDQLSLVSVLVAGEPGCGKTALAAKVAFDAKFPFVRFVSPDKFIGMSEQTKSSAIADAFEEAYKSESSLILLEDIERLIDYSRIGPRFSNQVLQTLLILVRKPPTKPGHRLMIVATTSVPDLIEPLDLVSVFNMVVRVPQIAAPEEVMAVARHVAKFPNEDMVEIQTIAQRCPLPISVKRLLIALDMSQDEQGHLSNDKFWEFMASV